MNERSINQLYKDVRDMKRNEYQVAALSTWLAMPALVSCWDMRSIDAENKIYDHSGQGRSLEMMNGFTQNSGIPSYLSLTNAQWLFRYAETGIANTGAMTYATWVRQAAFVGGFFGSRWNILNNQRVWDLGITAGGSAGIAISTTGIATQSVFSTKLLTVNTWAFLCWRYTPATELAIFHNMTKTTLAVGVFASLFSGYAKFQINGRDFGGGQLHAFDVGLTAQYNYALSDASIYQLFQSSRGWYGV